MSSRWETTSTDNTDELRRRADRELRRKQKKQRKTDETHRTNAQPNTVTTTDHGEDRPNKRRRITPPAEDAEINASGSTGSNLLRFPIFSWQPCRSADRFLSLNHIEEGSYGSVSRAREEATGDIVAIKKLKTDLINDGGFPVTALREIQCLRAANHQHIVRLREVVCGQGGVSGNVYLVMDFVEHDLKTLQEDMVEPFLPSEIKTLMLQLGSAVEYLHDRWILHRDLKTSNILLNNKGEIKVADFGMARLCGDPPPRNLTRLVVTLWYRAPEILLGAKDYASAIDVWSMGCIFGELLCKGPLLQGKNEVDQLRKIFALCGIPTNNTWPTFRSLPNSKTLRLPANPQFAAEPSLQIQFSDLSVSGLDLMARLLSLDPARRISAGNMLDHPYFREEPRPKPTSMFPTFPSKARQEKRRHHPSPVAPIRGAAPAFDGEMDLSSIFSDRENARKQ